MLEQFAANRCAAADGALGSEAPGRYAGRRVTRSRTFWAGALRRPVIGSTMLALAWVLILNEAAAEEPRPSRRGAQDPAKRRREKFWTGQHWQKRRNWHQDPRVFRYPEDRSRFERDLPRLIREEVPPGPHAAAPAARQRRQGGDDGLVLRARAARPPEPARGRQLQNLDPVRPEQHVRDPRLRLVVRDRQRRRRRLPLRPRRERRDRAVAAGGERERYEQRSRRRVPSSSPSGSPRSGRTARRRASSGAASRRRSSTRSATSSASPRSTRTRRTSSG